MRLVLLAATFALTPPSPSRKTRGLRQSVCDRSKIGARDLAECLRAASDKSDKELVATIEAAIKSVRDAAEAVVVAEGALETLVNDAETQWIGWRDSECQDVAPFEPA